MQAKAKIKGYDLKHIDLDCDCELRKVLKHLKINSCVHRKNLIPTEVK